MVFIGYLAVIIAVCFFMCKSRAISFGWAAFFSFFFSLPVGIVIMLFTRRYGNARKKPYSGTFGQNTRLVILGLLLLLLIVVMFQQWPSDDSFYINVRAYSEDYSQSEYMRQQMNPRYAFLLIYISWIIGIAGTIVYFLSNADTYVYEPVETETLETLPG